MTESPLYGIAKSASQALSRRILVCPNQHFFTKKELEVLDSVIDAFLPNLGSRVPIAEIMGADLEDTSQTRAQLYPWRPVEYKAGLQHLNKEARKLYGDSFTNLRKDSQLELLERVSRNLVTHRIWKIPADIFFHDLMLDIEYWYNFFFDPKHKH